MNRRPPEGAVPQHYFKEGLYKRYPAEWLEEAKPQPVEVMPGEATTTTTRVAEAARTIKTGLNKELKGNIFDLGERSSADLMRTTQIKIAQYIGSLYGGDIMGELETKTEFVAVPPEFPQTAKDKQAGYETMIRATQRNNLANLRRKKI